MNEPTLAQDEAYALPTVRAVDSAAPLRWLTRGCADLLAAPAASLFYGVVLASMGYALVHYYGGAVGLALTTGFLLAGPFLAVGIYDISRRIAAGEAVALIPTLSAWLANLPAIGFYALILMLSLAVWMRISVVLIALLVPPGTEGVAAYFELLVNAPSAWFFLAIYVAVGALLASFSFAISAVALPMLLDRQQLDAVSAMIVSFRAIQRNPRAMLLWAMLIVILTIAGFASWFAGLVVTIPVIGHATWHAYIDCVGKAPASGSE